MCSIIGALTRGIIGFGAFEVSGRSRVPSPPAMITAFMRQPPGSGLGLASASPRHRDVQDGRPVRQDEAGEPEDPGGVRAPSAQPSVLWEARNSGNESISNKVPAFPNHVTSIRRTPRRPRVTVAPPTRHLPHEHRHGEPRGHRAVDDDPADADDEQQAVGHRVEDLAEVADLVEAAGDVAVEEVGDAQPGQQPGGRGAVLLAEEEPEEQRAEAQPHDRDDVGDGEDAVLAPGGAGLLHVPGQVVLHLVGEGLRVLTRGLAGVVGHRGHGPHPTMRA